MAAPDKALIGSGGGLLGSRCSAVKCCLRPRCCSLDALPCGIPVPVQVTQQALLAALTTVLTQLRNGCELVQAEKERKELETQFKALYRDKYIPLKEAHKAGKTVTPVGPLLSCQG